MGDWKLTGTVGVGGAGPTPTPGNIVPGTPTLVAVNVAGVPHVRVTFPYTAPTSLNGFDRVHTYLQAPDDAVVTKAAISSGTPATDKGFRVLATADTLDDKISRVVPTQEAADMGITVDNPKERIITFTYPMPARAEYWRAYCAPGSKDVEPVLVKGTGAGATPSVRFQVDPVALQKIVKGLEYVPVAASFTPIAPFPRYGTQDGGNAWYGFDVEWTDSTSDPRYADLGGHAVWIEYPDGRRESTSGKLPLAQQTFTSDRWPQGAYSETFTLWLVPWRKSDGQENTIVDGITPKLVMTVVPQRGTAGKEYTGLTTITGVTQDFTLNPQGQKTSLRLVTAGTGPQDTNGYGGFQLFMIRKYGTDQASLHALTGTGERFPVTSYIDAYPDTDELVAMYALSNDSNNRANTYVPGVTPLYQFMLKGLVPGTAGTEYTSVATVTACTADYVLDGQGQKGLRLTVGGTVPEGDQTFGGMSLFIIRNRNDVTGAGDHRLLRSQQPRFPIEAWITDFPAGSGEFVGLYALSIDVNNKPNTFVRGVTPLFDMILPGPTTGGVGTEYAPLVIAPLSASLITVTEVTTDDGTTMLKVVSNYNNPPGQEYGGAQIVAHRPPYGGNDYIMIGEEREWGHAHYIKGPSAVETWRVYVRSRDVNGRYNSIVYGTTPRQDVSVGSVGGRLDLTKADVARYNIAEFWVNPTTQVFEQKVISADKIMTGTLLVGGYVLGTQTSRPGQMLVTDGLGNGVMWAGQNGLDYGLWAKMGGFGGTALSNAKIKLLSDGSVIINGATFTLNANSTTVTIDNSYNPTVGGYVGLLVQTDAVASADRPGARVHPGGFMLTQLRAGLDTALAYLSVSGSVLGNTASGSLNLNNYDLSRTITLSSSNARMSATATVSGATTTATLDGLNAQLLLNGLNVVKTRYPSVPVTLADVITIMRYHGLCN